MEISEIIESVDILDYISQFCELEQKQDGEYWGLSPLKDEKTPSFSVNKEKQMFYDFSSGKGGNVLDFIKSFNKCSVGKAVQILKGYANIDENSECINTKIAATSIAKKYKIRTITQKESKTTILPNDYMDRYEFNEDKLQEWKNEGITDESLRFFQVRYDAFSNRIVYPIRDINGNIINVGGRTLDPDYKAKKLRKYTYFKPLGILDTIYGFAENIEEILDKNEIIIFEGAKSVMVARGWGIKNTGAILTSHLNPYQFELLIKLGVRVVFALDSDVNIYEDENIKKLIPYTQVEWVRNRDNLLKDKESPVDRGFLIYKELYDKRGRLR